jgi:predicted nucleotide-binding protein
MPRCQGAIILALARWRWPIQGDVALMPSEYSHFEGALALSHSLPTWIVAEEGVMNRGIVWTGGGHAITYVSLASGSACMADSEMANSFQTWVEEVKSRPRVFLGYCGQARATANELQLFMERTLDVTVRNYAMDFSAGGTILDEIEQAGRDCTCGIFLFTKDDPLISTDSGTAAPRDNVVFEAGYFIRAKGKQRTLIIREEGAKMPADLGGNIYISLKDRNDISAIHTSLNRFLAERL